MIFFVFIFFCESYRKSKTQTANYKIFKANSLSGEHHGHGFEYEIRKHEFKELIFQAQRNFYLTGFTLFLTFALNIFMQKQKRICELEDDIDVMEKTLKDQPINQSIKEAKTVEADKLEESKKDR